VDTEAGLGMIELRDGLANVEVTGFVDDMTATAGLDGECALAGSRT